MWFKIQDQQITLLILAKPHAKKTALLAVSDQGLSVALHAKPIKGAANKELISYLAHCEATSDQPPSAQIIDYQFILF